MKTQGSFPHISNNKLYLPHICLPEQIGLWVYISFAEYSIYDK